MPLKLSDRAVDAHCRELFAAAAQIHGSVAMNFDSLPEDEKARQRAVARRALTAFLRAWL